MAPRPPARQAVRPVVQRFRPFTHTEPTGMLLNEQAIVGMSKNGPVLTEFPFFRLGNIYKQGGCKCTARAVDRNKLTNEVSRIKGAIKGLPPDRLERLKALLGVKVLSMTMPGSNVQITL